MDPGLLEAKTRQVMRAEGCDWLTARRILAQRAGAARHRKALFRKKAAQPQPIQPWRGARLVVERRFRADIDGSASIQAIVIAHVLTILACLGITAFCIWFGFRLFTAPAPAPAPQVSWEENNCRLRCGVTGDPSPGFDSLGITQPASLSTVTAGGRRCA